MEEVEGLVWNVQFPFVCDLLCFFGSEKKGDNVKLVEENEQLADSSYLITKGICLLKMETRELSWGAKVGFQA